MKLILTVYIQVNAFLRKLRDDSVSAFSAQAAFFTIISFFPFAMFLLTLVQYIPGLSEATLLKLAHDVVPKGLNSYVVSIIGELYEKSTGTILSVAAVMALWSASRGFLAIIRGLNSAFGIKETRNYVRIRILSTFYTLIFAIMLILTMALLVFGNSLYLWIEQQFPRLNDLALLLISIRTTAVLSILVLFFTALYVIIPNRHTRILSQLPGALLASAGWMGFSYLYSFYIQRMGRYSYTYGSLTAIVLFMLWLYSCMYILFIGAEVNDFLREKNWFPSLTK